MKRKIELLAPAGNREALHAAVENGADAVYLGGKLFNARQQAENFDMEMLREELRYAHARDVSIYLTLNTLLRDDEIGQALAYAEEACSAGIDGIIVQDMGLAGALRSRLPELPLHGSTQTTVYDLEGARALEEMGFQRVVTARELTLEQAAVIARNTRLEVEIFIHGALCVCYSGQCLMSSLIGGRSGNRGNCAQPCRLPYRLIGSGSRARRDDGIGKGVPTPHTFAARPAKAGPQTGYLLSPKDMCALDHLGEIAAAGIRSLKIEGRMKSPEYVATVVRIYRKYLDIALEQLENGAGTRLEVDERDRHDLLQIFNRGGFSSGYLTGKSGSDMMTYEKPNNSGVFIGTAAAYDNKKQTVSIRLEDDLSVGDGVEVWTGGSDSPGGTVSMIRTGGKSVRRASKGDFAEVGYFKGRISPGRKLYKTTDIELNRAARESFAGRNSRRVAIKGKVIFKAGMPLTLKVDDENGHVIRAEGTVLPQVAVNKPLTEERLREQIGKTGSTPFIFSELDIEMDDGLAVPVSEINEVRRQALESLYNERADRYAGRRCECAGQIDNVVSGYSSYTADNTEMGDRASANPLISLYFYKWNKDMELTGLGADRVYLPISADGRPGCAQIVKAARSSGVEVFFWLPPITSGNYENVIERFLQKHIKNTDGYEKGVWDNDPEHGADGILAANIGALHKLRGIGGLRLAGDIHLNLFNARSILEAASYGIESAAISVELTVQQISGMLKELNNISDIFAGTGQSGCRRPDVEAAVYGRLPLMTSEYCPVGSVEGGFRASSKCSGCCSKGSYELEDRLDMGFPVLCDNTDCRSTILNSNVLFVPDSMGSLIRAGVNIFRFYVWDEDPDTIRGLTGLYRASAEGSHDKADAYAGLVDRIKAKGFTKGHYYRGV
jgi:putative protease